MKLFFFFLFSQALFAGSDNTIWVTADRATPIGLGHGMTSSYTVTAEEIETKQYRQVYEALHDIPGVDVVAPNNGQTANIFIRGAKSEQTLLLVDGIPWNDPTDPTRGLDLNILPIEGVERIEVIRGAQSVLLPGVGGVIHVITKSGRGHQPRGYISSEGGSRGSIRGEMGVDGVTAHDVGFSFHASGFSTDGLSASINGGERDGASGFSARSKLSKKWGSQNLVQASVIYNDAKNDLDRVPVDTPNYQATKQELGFRLQGSTVQGSWQPTLGLGGKFIDRTAVDLGSSPNARFQSQGAVYKADWHNAFSLNESHRFIIGLEGEEERADIYSDFTGAVKLLDRKAQTGSLLAQYDWMNDWGPYLTAGVRGDYHSSFYFYSTYRVAAGYGIEATKTRIKTAVGTGYRAPSLYQLYGEFGNSRLKPEESLSIDFGLEQEFLNKTLSAQATYFRRYDRELIDFDFATSQYSNVAKAKSEGIEIGLSWIPLDGGRVQSHYTFTECQDENTGLTLLRRPRHKWKNSFLFRKGNWEGSVEHLLVGVRTDIDATTFSRKELFTYHGFNLAGSWQAWPSGKIFMRIENLLNTQYQVIDGYSTAGFSVFGGIRQEL